MLNQDVCYFYNAHSVYSAYGGIAFTGSEGERIAESLGRGKAAILMNHGLLTVGGTVDEAAYLFTLMERSCQVQLLTEGKGIKKNLVTDEEAAYNFKMASTPVNDILYKFWSSNWLTTHHKDTLYCEFQPHLNYEDYKSGGNYKN
jgi:ribulose-5-phosphate 4-epimerase/fuculose-1-phosphate aldolase